MASYPSINYAAMAALLLLWLAMAEGSIYRIPSVQTSEAMTEDDMFPEAADEGAPAPIWCEMEHTELEECETYVENGRNDNDVEMMIRSWLKRGGSGRNGRERPPRRCCQQLKETKEDCRCDAIRQLVTGWEGSREHEAKIQRAENLPVKCGISPDRCHIQRA